MDSLIYSLATLSPLEIVGFTLAGGLLLAILRAMWEAWRQGFAFPVSSDEEKCDDC
jgi:hypothetical protein